MIYMFVKLGATFLIVRFILAWMPARMRRTPARTKSPRVHRRPVERFRASCELETRGRTGVLLYLSIAERRGVVVADEAIATKVAPEVWGDAMAALLDEVKQGRPGHGMAIAVEKIGAVLARVLPARADNPDELPNRLITL